MTDEYFRDVLIRLYFAKYGEDYINTDEGRIDLKNHLVNRYLNFKDNVKWISQWIDLSGKKVLEVGCGTGSSTLAFVEENCEIIALDIDRDALSITDERLKWRCPHAKVQLIHTSPFISLENQQKFDIVLFPAALEHMSIEERLFNINASWNLLYDGGYLIILETPNRLWYYDHHTSFLPFFNWLDADISKLYIKKSDRDFIKRLNSISKEYVIRLGNGFSYHEIELALNINIENLKVVSYLSQTSNFSMIRKIKYYFSIDSLYKYLLRKITLNRIHPAFFEPFLNIIIQKTK